MPVAIFPTAATAALPPVDEGRPAGLAGDPQALTGWAQQLLDLASAGFGDGSLRVRAAGSVLQEWRGPGAAACRDRLGVEQRRWADAARLFGELARLVRWYARVLEQAQGLAERAAALTQQGLVEHQRWELALALAAASGDAAVQLYPDGDPGPPWWRAAQGLLAEARRRVGAAELVLVAALARGKAAAPLPPGFRAEPGRALTRVAVGFAGAGLDVIASASRLDPSRWWLDHEPYRKDLLDRLGSVGAGVDLLAHDPGAVAQHLWDRASGDPATASGVTLFGLAAGSVGWAGKRLLLPARRVGLAGGGVTGTDLLDGGGSSTVDLRTVDLRTVDLGEALQVGALDANTLAAQHRLGVLGAVPQKPEWVIPDGPTAPWHDPDLFRIDPRLGRVPRNSTEAITKAWGDRLFVGKGSAGMLQELQLVPPGTMELLAAHARTDDWHLLVEQFRRDVFPSATDSAARLHLGELRAAAGDEGLYLGMDVAPAELRALMLQRGWSGVTSFVGKFMIDDSRFAALHEAGHAVNGIFSRSPMPSAGWWPTGPGHALFDPTDSFVGLAGQVREHAAPLTWRDWGLSLTGRRIGPVDADLTLRGSVDAFPDGQHYYGEVFAEGMKWYWGRDHSGGPAPLAGLPLNVREALFDYFHNEVPRRLTRTQFPASPFNRPP